MALESLVDVRGVKYAKSTQLCDLEKASRVDEVKERVKTL
jgi:hypothetical protein